MVEKVFRMKLLVGRKAVGEGSLILYQEDEAQPVYQLAFEIERLINSNTHLRCHMTELPEEVAKGAIGQAVFVQGDSFQKDR